VGGSVSDLINYYPSTCLAVVKKTTNDIFLVGVHAEFQT
jgi:hypothetical protein